MKHFSGLLLVVVTALTAESGFANDPPLPPEPATKAAAHVVVVRHAYPACSDLQCALNEEGYRQADELARLLTALKDQNIRIKGVYASSTCRTILTATPAANDAGVPVEAFPARDGYPTCGYLGDGDGLVRPTPDRKPHNGLISGQAPAASRTELMSYLKSEAANNDGAGIPAYLVVDHSNFVCEWFKAFDVPVEDIPEDCGEEGLALTDYADIYWMYEENGGAAATWRLFHYENAFDRGIPNAYEQ